MTQGLNQQVNIDPNDLSDITCQKVLESLDKCGSQNFRQVFQMKKLSALMSPNGQEQVVTIPVFICDNCGEPLSQELGA
tara:strand:+ start:1011 stop:1247 length:237 start_codon:yes stop_codon:yes gene_type:complete